MFVAGRVLGVAELFGLAVAAVVLVLVGTVRVRAARLEVSLRAAVVPVVASVSERAVLELTVENTGSDPTPDRRLRLLPQAGAPGPMVEVPRLVPGERAAVSLAVPTSRRGWHEVAGFDGLLVDGLGLAERRLASVGPSRYGIRPAYEVLAQVLPAAGGDGLETTESAAERIRSGTSLLRPYVAGDDLRRAHWPTTARVGEIMVREGGDRERGDQVGVTIVLCPRTAATLAGGAALAGSLPTTADFEDAVGVAASLAVAAEREGPFRMVIAGVADSGEGSGARHLDAALDSLIDVTTEPVPWGGPEGSAVLDGSSNGAPGAGAGLAGVVLLVAACPDPAQLPAVFGAPPEHFAPRADTLIVICTGAQSTGFSPIDRGRLLARLERGGSLAALWGVSDPALVRA
jgi:uncharacterized protein (DUF58 family)